MQLRLQVHLSAYAAQQFENLSALFLLQHQEGHGMLRSGIALSLPGAL